ncbi:MAG TPA: hypothetical protein VE011_07025 [Candidatus Dormibacteraeota bacterium]|nr:hypothetical protein [Candidatus Dormibacteraeota bacterium]
MRITRGRLNLLLVALLLGVGACQSPPPSPTQQLGFRSLPVDASLVPLSRSHLAPDAEAALNLCIVPTSEGQIVGGALLASARDVAKYMPTNGNEPELQSDGPVWLFQLTGTVFTPPGAMVNPVCMVRGSARVWYYPYDAAGNPRQVSGIQLPSLSLPPLTP